MTDAHTNQPAFALLLPYKPFIKETQMRPSSQVHSALGPSKLKKGGKEIASGYSFRKYAEGVFCAPLLGTEIDAGNR